jgi:hypothetical protein
MEKETNRTGHQESDGQFIIPAEIVREICPVENGEGNEIAIG